MAVRSLSELQPKGGKGMTLPIHTHRSWVQLMESGFCPLPTAL